MTALTVTSADSGMRITATDQTPSAMPPTASERCQFLKKIPAELRNDIYRLAFTSDHDTKKKVNLFQAAPPQKSILSTCRQVYQEAREYYIEAYRDYWQDTEFRLTCEKPFDPNFRGDDSKKKVPDTNKLKAIDKVELVTFQSRDVDHIRKISVYREVQFSNGSYGAKHYVLRNGVWSEINDLSRRRETLEFRFRRHEPYWVDVFDAEWRQIPFSFRKSNECRLPMHLQLACLIWHLAYGTYSVLGVGALPVWGRLGCKK